MSLDQMQLLHIAKDYDVDYDIVSAIASKYPDEDIYEKMEEYIKERANKH